MSDNVMRQLVPMKEILFLQGAVDEQSAELAGKVYCYFLEKFKFSPEEREAFARLMACLENKGSWGQALQRNNLFKAAHSLGMEFPSSSF